MTKSFFSFTALALAGAFGFAQNYPNAEQTVPDRMGWMQGFLFPVSLGPLPARFH